MQVTETVSDGLKREYKVVIPAGDMAEKIDARLAELQQTIKLKGFRPGKVPVALLKKQFGQSVVGEVVQQTLQDTSGQVITEQGVRPAMQPRVEEMSFDEGTDLAYTLAIEVMPQIETGDFSAIEMERLDIQVADSEVDDAISRMLERSKDFEDTEEGYAAQQGDSLTVNFSGKIDGELFDGGTADDQQVELGAGRLLPEFEAGLENRKAGDKFQVEVPFPEDYGAENLAGKTATFDIEVKAVRKAKTPVLDDDFAKRQGTEGVEDLKAKVREQLAREYAQLARQRMKRELLDKLAEMHDFDVPPSLADTEFRAIWSQVERERGKDHAHDHDHDHDHDHHDHDHDHAHDHAEEDDEETAKMKAEYRDIAVRRVRLGLLLSEVGRTNSIQVTPEDMQQAVIERARQFPGQEARVVQYYQQNPEAVQELTAPILEDRVIDHVLTQVKVTERPVTPEEFMAIEQDDDGEEAAEAKPAKKKAAAKKSAAKSEDGEKKPAKKAAAKKAAAKNEDASEEAAKKPKASKKKKTEDEA